MHGHPAVGSVDVLGPRSVRGQVGHGGTAAARRARRCWPGRHWRGRRSPAARHTGPRAARRRTCARRTSRRAPRCRARPTGPADTSEESQPVDGEGRHARRARGRRRTASRSRPRRWRSSPARSRSRQRVPRAASIASPVAAQRGAGRREGDGADDVGAAALVACGPVVPHDAALGHRAASRRRRRGRASAASSQSRRPASTPAPNGAYELVAGEARRSRRPSAARSTARCGASWAASTTTRAPCPLGDPRPARATGHTSPVTLEAPATTTSRWRGRVRPRARRLSSRARRSTLRAPAGGGSGAPRQGSSVEWCSVSKTNTSVRRGRPGRAG